MTLKVKVYNTTKVLTADSTEVLRVNAGLMQEHEGKEDVQVLELNRDYPLTTTANEIKEDLTKARDNFITEEASRVQNSNVDATISELNGLEIE
jgi:hypothetical protein